MRGKEKKKKKKKKKKKIDQGAPPQVAMRGRDDRADGLAIHVARVSVQDRQGRDLAAKIGGSGVRRQQHLYNLKFAIAGCFLRIFDEDSQPF
jgi:hypothetical protein